ncbi:MAG: hypothetical protein FJW35_15965, partial [Acidobacteria bacterium]|nr:hypothetical protein [Acidobacteriota bacterium]
MSRAGPGTLRRWVFAVAATSIFIPEGAAQADAVRVAIESSDQGLRLSLVWPSPVGFSHSVEGRELILRFSGALDCPDLDELPST